MRTITSAPTVIPAEIVARQRTFFRTGKTKDLDNRLEQLQRLRDVMKENEAEILEAMKKDLGKPETEGFLSDVFYPIQEIEDTIKNLKSWASPRRVRLSLLQQPGKGYIMPEPFGVATIISPWNYPFLLSIVPLAGAIAAGNTVILKPSEFAPHCSHLMASMIRENFPSEWIYVLEGDVEVNKALLKEKLDYIFFTGSTPVGKIVMKAAAEHLTPVTLELGGKSPCIIDESVNLEVAVKRIIWGKFFNAGQSCVAPDYILVHHTLKEAMFHFMRMYIKSFFGDHPEKSPDLGRIINDRHFQRVSKLIQGNIIIGGTTIEEERFIAPTVIDVADPETHPAMQEEIFAPVLPIISYSDLDEAIHFVNERPKPLSLYFFSTNKKRQHRVLQETSSGGVMINDVVAQFVVPEIPFGGIGDSGMGAYHGKETFETFSHHKGVVNKGFIIDPAVRYPPYKLNLKIVKDLMKWIT